MAVPSAHLLALAILLTISARAISGSSFGLRGAERALKHDACFTPTSQDDLPPEAGPNDLNSPFLCFGFQFGATHDTTPIETRIEELFVLNTNRLLNPFVTLAGSAAEGPRQFRSGQNQRLWYPLNDTTLDNVTKTYSGNGSEINPIRPPFFASYAYQLPDNSGTNVSTRLINRVLRNLGKWLQRNYPIAGARRIRPGITDFQITTWFVRQDATVNSGANVNLTGTFNDTSGEFTVVPAKRSCKYV